MNPLNNEYFGSNTTLDEKAYDHVLAAVVTFAEKVDIKDTNIEEGIDIYSPGDEYLGLFVLPSLLDACGVSYERVIGGCIATTTRGGGISYGSISSYSILQKLLPLEGKNGQFLFHP